MGCAASTVTPLEKAEHDISADIDIVMGTASNENARTKKILLLGAGIISRVVCYFEKGGVVI